MIAIRRSRPDEGLHLVALWRAAVDATHDFLRPHDRAAIDGEAAAWIQSAPLWVAVDPGGRLLGFMGLGEGGRGEGRLEALFVAPGHHGRGIGRALVAHAAALKPVLDTEVNAQNGPAVGFYRALGFVETGRSPDDGEGRPYPIIRLRLQAAGDARTERGTHGSAVPRAHGPVAVPPDQAS